MKIVRGPGFPHRRHHPGPERNQGRIPDGQGQVIVRAKVTVESSSPGKDSIIVTEIPYQVNKSALIVRIADLVKEKKIDGIVDLNDESDRHGMRIVIDLRKGVSPKVILNQLFAHTQLQAAFGVNNLALVNGLPKTLSLKEMLEYFIAHRKEVVTRRTRFELREGRGTRPYPRGLEDRPGEHRRSDRASSRSRRTPRRRALALMERSPSPRNRLRRSSTCACSASPASRCRRSSTS